MTKYAGGDKQPTLLDKFVYDYPNDTIYFGGDTAYNYGYHHYDIYEQVEGLDNDDTVQGFVFTPTQEYRTRYSPDPVVEAAVRRVYPNAKWADRVEDWVRDWEDFPEKYRQIGLDPKQLQMINDDYYDELPNLRTAINKAPSYRGWPQEWKWFTSWIYLPIEDRLIIKNREGYGHGTLLTSYEGDISEVPAVYGVILQNILDNSVGVLTEYSDWAKYNKGQMVEADQTAINRVEDQLKEWGYFVDKTAEQMDALYKVRSGSRIAAQYQVEEEHSKKPEDGHDAWVYVPETKTLYFMHGGHHYEIFDRQLDPEVHDITWLGDIENGTIRFYERMQLKLLPWNSDPEEFHDVMNLIKNLNLDYHDTDIDIDYSTHAKIIKKAFSDTMYRWLWDPVHGLTVWPTMVEEDTRNYHSLMLTKLFGLEYYKYEDYTGGYVYPPSKTYPYGRISQTYKAYYTPALNKEGLDAISAWLEGNQQMQMNPALQPTDQDFRKDPRFKQSYLDQLDERMRWIYAPSFGGFHVWPFYQKNHGDVLDEIGVYQYLPIDPDSPIQKDQDWCGGYIERDGTVWETYTSPKRVINVTGLWLARGWVREQLDVPMQGLATNRFIRPQIPDAALKWAYTPEGELEVWQVNEMGEPQHYWHRGRESLTREAQGHIYYVGDGKVALYTHPTRPQQAPEESFSDWMVRKDTLIAQAQDAVKNWIINERKPTVEGKRQRPLKKRRRHIRKKDYHLFIIGYPYGGGAVYPEGGQVDTTMG